jgi:putative transposase
MSSYRQILYHIIFRTKNGNPTLNTEHSKELFAYILGIIKNKKCVLYRINGIEDHIHMLTDLHPDIALAAFMRDIKTATSIWLKQNGKFPEFEGWADGYAALTYAWRDKDLIINYIIKQQEHHKNRTFSDEYRQLLHEHGIEIEEKYFLK